MSDADRPGAPEHPAEPHPQPPAADAGDIPAEITGAPLDDRPPMERNSVARNTRHLLVAQGLTWTMALILTAVEPRLIGAEGLGDLRLAGSLWSIAAIFVIFGVAGPITLAFARDEGDSHLLSTAMTLQAMTWVLACVGMAVFCVIADYEGNLLAIVAIFAISTLLSSWNELGRATFYGLESMAWPSRVDVIIKACSIAIIVPVLILGGRSVAMAIVGVVIAAINVVLMLGGLQRRARLRLRPRVTGVPKLMKVAAPFLMIDASNVLYRQSDTIIIAAIAGSTQVGWYSVAEVFLGSLLVIPTLVLSAVFPALARSSSASPEHALNQVRRGTRLIWLFAVPLGLGTAVISPGLARVVFGPDFEKSGPILAVMGIVMIVMVPTILLGNYALALGLQRKWVAINWTALIVSIPLHLLIDPWTNRRFGSAALGAAIVFAITETLIFVMAVRRVAPRLFDRSVTSGFLKVFGAGAVMVAATWPLRHRMLLIPMAVGAVTFIVALMALRMLNDEEKALLRKARHRFLRR